MQRNYRYFILFVSSSALLCSFVVAMSALNVKLQMDNYGTLWKGVKAAPASVILMAYSFFFLWFVGGLTCFHLFLICTNQVSFAFSILLDIMFICLSSDSRIYNFRPLLFTNWIKSFWYGLCQHQFITARYKQEYAGLIKCVYSSILAHRNT